MNDVDRGAVRRSAGQWRRSRGEAAALYRGAGDDAHAVVSVRGEEDELVRVVEEGDVDLPVVANGSQDIDALDGRRNRTSLSFACWAQNLNSPQHEGVTDDRRFSEQCAAV